MPGCFAASDYTLENSQMMKVCKYHKRRGQQYAPGDVVRDFCPDAFFVAYPYCLALLYGAKSGEFARGRVRVRCPAPGGITMEVARTSSRSWLRRVLKKSFEWAMSRTPFGRPDWEDWAVSVTVVEAGGGPCGRKYAVGSRYWFNTAAGRLDELCPASFHGLYPVLLPFLAGGDAPWKPSLGAPANELLVHCPDHEGMAYTVRRHAPGKRPLPVVAPPSAGREPRTPGTCEHCLCRAAH